jgi:hypothetical protein
MPKADGVQKATGRDRAGWFALLDEWGAVGRPYRDIAAWLTSEHGLSRWWAQKLIVEYEQARGVRPPGVRPGGTFEVSASKTVAVPAARLFAAFVDGRRRRRWLPDATMKLTSSRRPHAARFEWDDGRSRVSVDVVAKGRERATVAVTHKGLSDADAARATKEMWRRQLVELKSRLEA